MSEEKAKKAPHTLKTRLVVWLTLVLLPLILGMSVFLIQGMMDSYVRTLVRPSGASLVYLPMLINDVDQDGLVAVFSLCLFVVYMLLIRKYFPRAAIVLWGIVVAFLLCVATLGAIGPTGLDRYYKILQTLSTQNHVYQLVEQAECHHGCSHSYLVLECDLTGWTCHNYGTSSQQIMQLQPCSHPTPVVSLAQNAATYHLELTVDGETRVLNPTDDILIYGYSIDRCGIGGLRR